MRAFPHHWIMKPSETIMQSLYLLAGVRIHSNQELSVFAFSVSIALSISAISNFKNSDCESPSAWYLVKMAKASSRRSLKTSHRGDSGMKRTMVSWKIEENPWSALGNLQLQEDPTMKAVP